jgi:hypothetical protein
MAATVAPRKASSEERRLEVCKFRGYHTAAICWGPARLTGKWFVVMEIGGIRKNRNNPRRGNGRARH